jgi:hypothetical protein
VNEGLVYEDFARAANALNCEVAAIQAVCEVEAPKGGFFPDGTPATLFEGHWFSNFTNSVYDKTHPTISYPRWTRKHYGNWTREKERLAQAIALDREAALKSASWGKFQIMGFNYVAAGFKTLQSFVNAMHRSEGAQLDAFICFIKHEKLEDELREHRWADFARKYNGPGYAANQYDVKLAQAYRDFS